MTTLEVRSNNAEELRRLLRGRTLKTVLSGLGVGRLVVVGALFWDDNACSPSSR